MLNILEQHREDVSNEQIQYSRAVKKRHQWYDTTKAVLENRLGELQEETKKEIEMRLNKRKDLMGQVKASDGNFVFGGSKAT